MTDLLVTAVIEIVDVAVRSYLLTPASEPRFTNPDEVQEPIRDLKIGKAPGPNGIQNRAFMHLPQQAVSLLAQILNAIILTHHLLTVWKHARMMSILEPGKDPALPSPYRPNSLCETICKLLERILLARFLHNVCERRLMREE